LLNRHNEVIRWNWKFFRKGIARKPGVYPSAHVTRWRLPKILEMNLGLWNARLWKFQGGRLDIDICPELFLDSFLAAHYLPLHQVGLTADRIKRSSHQDSLLAHFNRLASYIAESPYADSDPEESDSCERYIHPKRRFIEQISLGGFDDSYVGLNLFLMFSLELCAVLVLLFKGRRDWRGWFLGSLSLLCVVRLGISLNQNDREEREYNRCVDRHFSKNVSQQSLTDSALLYYSYSSEADMANVLNTDKQIAVIAAKGGSPGLW
jgi:hypothetical protein